MAFGASRAKKMADESTIIVDIGESILLAETKQFSASFAQEKYPGKVVNCQFCVVKFDHHYETINDLKVHVLSTCTCHTFAGCICWKLF
jgi:hypothetical protein